MMRLHGWESRLHQAIEDHRQVPYALGHSDCVSLACAAIKALTGVDHWPRLKGQYSSRDEAIELTARHGRSFADAVAKQFGLERIPKEQAGRGDLVLYRDEGGVHLTICVGSTCVGYGPDGIVFIERDDPRLGEALRV